jgi:hypothetical protein
MGSPAMINALYDNARERLLNAQMNWPSLSLLMTAWGGNPETSFNPSHTTQAALGTPIATSQAIVTPSVRAGGYAASSFANFLAIPMGTNVQFVVLCEANATPANRKLIAYMADVNGLPFPPNGGDYLFKPDWLFSQGWFRA